MQVRVRCIFEIEVEMPDDMDPEMVRFTIEENGCPGTGIVGSTLDQHIKDCDAASMCWACALDGKNEIVSRGK